MAKRSAPPTKKTNAVHRRYRNVGKIAGDRRVGYVYRHNIDRVAVVSKRVVATDGVRLIRCITDGLIVVGKGARYIEPGEWSSAIDAGRPPEIVPPSPQSQPFPDVDAVIPSRRDDDRVVRMNAALLGELLAVVAETTTCHTPGVDIRIPSDPELPWVIETLDNRTLAMMHVVIPE